MYVTVWDFRVLIKIALKIRRESVHTVSIILFPHIYIYIYLNSRVNQLVINYQNRNID